MFSNSMKSSLSFIMPLLIMSTSEWQYSRISFLKSNTQFSRTRSSYHFRTFGFFIRFHLVVTIVYLTGYITYVVFVTFLVKVMWKVPLFFLSSLIPKVLGNDLRGICRKFKLSINLMDNFEISMNIILAPLYMQ